MCAQLGPGQGGMPVPGFPSAVRRFRAPVVPRRQNRMDKPWPPAYTMPVGTMDFLTTL